MSHQLVFELTLLSDYHVGSGHRSGTEIDSQLLREADGRPALRGTTLAALMRDGLQRLLAQPPLAAYRCCRASDPANPDPALPAYCGQHNPLIDDCPVCRLFGSARHPRPWRFSSAWVVGATGRDEPAIARQPSFAGLGSQPTTRVRIDPRVRRAAARQLFTEEVGDGRLRFRFAVTWQAPGEPTAEDQAFLVAAARMVRALGASRRRGRGECRLHLAAPQVEAAYLETFRHNCLETVYQPPAPAPRHWPTLPPVLPAPAGETPYRVWVIARLDEPLIMAKTPTSGSAFESLEYIPGTLLLGALAGRAAARNKLSEDGQAYQTFVAHFLRGQVKFGFLYPATFPARVSSLLIPAVPAPKDLLTCKRHPFGHRSAHATQGYATTPSSQSLRCPDCQAEALEAVSGYLSLKPWSRHVVVGKREEMHNEMDPLTGRVRTGQLFGYVTLEAGHYFVGELICASLDAWQTLQMMVGLQDNQPATFRLGKAVRRGYGRVTLHFTAGQAAPWVGQPLAQRVPDPTVPLTMTLLTDAIVTDTWGRYETGFSEGWLSQALQLPAGEHVELLRAFSSTRPVDSFNNQIGLPRQQDLAIAAGSAVGLRYQGQLSPDQFRAQLARLEEEGLGWRRGEGFGQVAFNHPIYRLVAGQFASWEDEDVEIELPEVMQPASAQNGHLLLVEDSFRRQWRAELERTERKNGRATPVYDWRKVEKPEFVAVARLLLARRQHPLETITEQLANLGQLEKHLPQPERVINGQSIEKREQKPFFKEGEGQNGLKVIRAALDKLAELLASLHNDNVPAEMASRLQVVGLEMVAGYVAQAAEKAREKTG